MLMGYLILMLLLGWVCMVKWPLVAMILSLATTCIFFYLGLEFHDDWVLILSPGLFLSCYIYIGFFQVSEEHRRLNSVARWLLTLLTFLVLLVLVEAIFGPLVMAGVMMFLAWLAATVAYGCTARRSLLFSVLTTLKTCTRQNLPLPMALDCAAQGRTGHEAGVYRQIKNLLVKGYNLVDAMRVGWPQCPSHVLGVLDGAQRSGCLAEGLAAVHNHITLKDKRRKACEPVQPAYPIIVLIIVAVVMTALFRYVIPQFSVTLREIGEGNLPALTRWVIDICMNWGTPVLIGLGVLWGLWAMVVITGWFNKGQRPVWIANITDWVRWHLPFVHRFDRMFALIQLVETLNLCVRAGSPVDQAVSRCATLDVNRCFGRRIRRWHRLIEQGQSVSSAALKSGMPRAVAWAFDQNVNHGNAPEVLGMLEQMYGDRYVYHSNLLSIILGPCIIMMLAAVVCVIMLAIFLPMVSTITQLTGINP